MCVQYVLPSWLRDQEFWAGWGDGGLWQSELLCAVLAKVLGVIPACSLLQAEIPSLRPAAAWLSAPQPSGPDSLPGASARLCISALLARPHSSLWSVCQEPGTPQIARILGRLPAAFAPEAPAGVWHLPQSLSRSSRPGNRRPGPAPGAARVSVCVEGRNQDHAGQSGGPTLPGWSETGISVSPHLDPSPQLRKSELWARPKELSFQSPHQPKEGSLSAAPHKAVCSPLGSTAWTHRGPER